MVGDQASGFAGMGGGGMRLPGAENKRAGAWGLSGAAVGSDGQHGVLLDRLGPRGGRLRGWWWLGGTTEDFEG